MTKSLTIYQEKSYSMRIQITSTNAQLNDEFNDGRLKIQIEAKFAEEKKQKRHLEGKIFLNYKKFHYFTRENLLNSNSNDTDKCRIQW